MNEKRDQIQKDYKEGSFQRLFGDQQIAARSATTNSTALAPDVDTAGIFIENDFKFSL